MKEKSGKDDFQEVATIDKDKINFRRMLITASTAVSVLVLIVVIIAIVAGVNAYKEPVRHIVKGVNKADTLLLMENIYPEDMVVFKRFNEKNEGTAWKDYLKNNDDYIEKKMDEMGLKKAKCDIVAKEEIKGSNLEAIEDFYESTYEAEVKKAYRVEVNMTFSTKGGDETPSGWVCVVKIKDEGWKFCPEYSENHFDFIDEAIKFK